MKLILLAILLILSTPCWAVTNWDKSIPAAANSKSSWPGQVTAQWSILDTLLSNYKQGESVIYKNSTTLTITSGQVVVSNSGGSLRLFLNDGGNTDITTANLDTGASFSASTTYYVYAATSSSTAASSTYYISLSASAPTGPTYYVQLGYFITNGSGNVVGNYGSIVNNNISTPPGFGSWSSKSTSTIYQAATDGFVLAWYSSSNNNVSLTVLTDSNPSPSTVRAETSDQSGTDKAFVMSPVRKNDYYQVTYFVPSSASVTVYWLPLGN